jgi:large subunit ribosomal protein L22
MAEKKPKAAKKSSPKATSNTTSKATSKAVKAKSPKASKPAAAPAQRIEYKPREARAFQRSTRQSPYKMRLVIDQIRGKMVNEALSLLAFSKKHAAKQIEKVLRSAVANAENGARNRNESIDVDELFVKHAIINEGIKMKRWTPAAMGRATPMYKRTSHVEIVVAERAPGAR